MSNLSPEMDFFIFLLNQYAYAKKTTADVVLHQWDAAGISDKVYNMYQQYHCEAIENAVADIDEMLAGR